MEFLRTTGRLQFILDCKIASPLDYIERNGLPGTARSASNNDGGDCPMIRRLSIVTWICLAGTGLASRPDAQLEGNAARQLDRAAAHQRMVFLVGAREVYTPRALFGDRRRAWSTN